jgi:hypothetical protein
MLSPFRVIECTDEPGRLALHASRNSAPTWLLVAVGTGRAAHHVMASAHEHGNGGGDSSQRARTSTWRNRQPSVVSA